MHNIYWTSGLAEKLGSGAKGRRKDFEVEFILPTILINVQLSDT